MLNRNKIFKTVRDTTNSLNVSTGKKMDNFYTELMTYEDMVQKRYDKIKDILNTIKYHHNKINNLDRNYTNAIFGGGGGKSLDDLLKNVEDAIETIETIETLEKLQDFESFTNLAAKIKTLEDQNVLKPKKNTEDQLQDKDDQLPDINGNQVKASDRSYFKEAKEALSSLDTLFNSDNTKIDKALEKIEKIKDPIVQYIKDYKLSREFIEVIKKGIIELKKQADTFRKNQKLKLDKYKNIIKEGDTRAIQAVKDDEDPNKDIDRKILQAYDADRKNLVFKMNADHTGKLFVTQDRKTNEYGVSYEQYKESTSLRSTLINNTAGYSFDTEDLIQVKKVKLVNTNLPTLYVVFNKERKNSEITALTYYFDISAMDTFLEKQPEMINNLHTELFEYIGKNYELVLLIKAIYNYNKKKNKKEIDTSTLKLIEKIPNINNKILHNFFLNEFENESYETIIRDFISQFKKNNSDSDEYLNNIKLLITYNNKSPTEIEYTNLRELIGLSKFTSIIDKVRSTREQNQQPGHTGGSDQITQLKSTLTKIIKNINENIDKEDRVKQNQNQPKQNQPKQNDIVKSAKTMFGVNTQEDDEDNKITNSIISSIIENYEKERSSVNTIEDKIKLDTKFVDILDNLGLNLSDIFKINFEDKLAFIFFILILHIVVYSIVESLIMNDYLTDIVYIMAVYVGVYFLIMFILILILNKYVNYRMKSVLNYLNTDFNMQLITMHLFIVFMFYIIVLILSQHIDIFIAKEEDDKLQILYRIEVISSIIFIFSGVFVMLL